MELDKLKVRSEAMNDGAWIPFGRDVEIKVRSAAIPEVRRKAQRAIEQARKSLGLRQGRDLPVDELEKALQRIAHGTYIVDWRGYTENGEPLACTPENFNRMCALDPTFLDRLLAVCGDEENFDVESLEVVESD